jgi:hypothetical protein
MFSFLKRNRPNKTSMTTVNSDVALRGDSKQPNDVKRELIKGVFSDTLRRHGIPHNWFACEVVVVTNSAGEDFIQIQLVMVHWQETFLRYGPALEQIFLRELIRIDPSTDHSRSQITWRFSPDCECPFKVMPPPHIWAHTEVDAGTNEIEQPGLFDRRRTKRTSRPTDSLNATGKHGRSDDQDDDYEPTLLSQL